MKEINNLNTTNYLDLNKEEVNDDFENKLHQFLKENELDLDIPDRKENVQTLVESENKEIVGDFVIANDFKLATEASKVTLAYKNGSDLLLVVKETTEDKMNELVELNNWGNLTVEEYLKEKGFNNENVVLPIEIIKKDGKVYRFYEAMDMDLEKYLEKHNKFQPKKGIALVLRASQGVLALNEAGISNIDLAPLNIMLTKHNLKLIDLDGASIDKDGSGIFKRNYLGNNRFASAPELFDERPVFDKTVDVYAASACLFRLIAGDWPYNIEEQTRDLPYEEKMAAFKKEHESGNIVFPEFMSPQLNEIIKKGMNPNREDRYQDIKDFMSDLINFSNSEK